MKKQKINKILILNPTMEKGGIETQLAVLLNNLNFQKFEVTLALFHNHINYKLPEDVKIIDLKATRLLNPIFLLKIFKLFSKEWDIINSKSKYTNILCLITAMFLKNKTFILEIQTSGKQIFSHYKFIKCFSYFIQKNFVIAANSKTAILEMKRIIGKNLNYKLIYNGIDIEKFEQKKLKNELLKIGYIGRIAPVKKIETIVEAVNYLISKKFIDNLSVELTGPIFDRKFIELIDKYNLSTFFKLNGPKDNVELFYSKLDLLVLPSEREGVSNTLLEAMASGVLCLASKGANKEKILSSEFTFETGNYIELAQKIIKLNNLSEHEKNIIIRKNKDKLIKEFSINKMVKKYQKLWNSKGQVI